jgi:hypothetical protein
VSEQSSEEAAAVAAEQKWHGAVGVVLNGRRGVVDLNIAGRLADISRAGLLPVCCRSGLM